MAENLIFILFQCQTVSSELVQMVRCIFLKGTCIIRKCMVEKYVCCLCCNLDSFPKETSCNHSLDMMYRPRRDRGNVCIDMHIFLFQTLKFSMKLFKSVLCKKKNLKGSTNLTTVVKSKILALSDAVKWPNISDTEKDITRQFTHTTILVFITILVFVSLKANMLLYRICHLALYS